MIILMIKIRFSHFVKQFQNQILILTFEKNVYFNRVEQFNFLLLKTKNYYNPPVAI